jgi:transcriptional regulator with XRE-family HTH domain
MGFRENLKSQLEYSSITVKELADLSGVKKQTLDSYLSTHSNIPSAEIAVKIAKVLGVTVEYLITGQEKPGAVSVDVSANSPETRLVKEMFNGLSVRNKKLALALIKTVKKQDEAEKVRKN